MMPEPVTEHAFSLSYMFKLIYTHFHALNLSDQLGQKPGSSTLPKQADPVIIDIDNDNIVDSRTEAERVIDTSFNALKLSDQLGQKPGSSVLPKQFDLSRTKQRDLSRTKQADPVIIDIDNDNIVDSRTEAERVIDTYF